MSQVCLLLFDMVSASVNNKSIVRNRLKRNMFYLKLMNFVTSSFLDTKLNPRERVYQIWYTNFALRLWSSWLTCDTTYSLRNSFVTLNIRDCVEINAHSLVLTILKLRSLKIPHLFLPGKMTSQSYKSFFLTMRSSLSTISTQTHFTMKTFALNRAKNSDLSIRLTAQNIIWSGYLKLG